MRSAGVCKSLVNVGATLAGLLVALELLRRVDAGRAGAVSVYLASNWEAPFGIVLVADRLSALMLVLVGVVSLGAALYAEARLVTRGRPFPSALPDPADGSQRRFPDRRPVQPLRLLRGPARRVIRSATARIRLVARASGLHYIAVNLLASSLFLIGLALFYGVMGTLSMADIAEKLPSVPASDRGLLHAGSAILAVAFLIKAAIWPLNSWLAPAYTAASAPVAAMFALMTKVGIYALVRLWTLLLLGGHGPSVHFGGDVLLVGGLVTIGVGTIGLMGAIHLGRIASFSMIVSSGTLLAALGMGVPVMLSAALYYLLSATLAVSALFLLGEMVERVEADGEPRLKEVDVETG